MRRPVESLRRRQRVGQRATRLARGVCIRTQSLTVSRLRYTCAALSTTHNHQRSLRRHNSDAFNNSSRRRARCPVIRAAQARPHYLFAAAGQRDRRIDANRRIGYWPARFISHLERRPRICFASALLLVMHPSAGGCWCRVEERRTASSVDALSSRVHTARPHVRPPARGADY